MNPRGSFHASREIEEMRLRSDAVKKGAADFGNSIRRLERGKMADPVQHAKDRVWKQARKDFSQRGPGCPPQCVLDHALAQFGAPRSRDRSARVQPIPS
jgi:hypothetical protein